MGGTTTFNTFRSFEVVCPVRGDHRFNLIVNMRSLSHIVKQLFMKIVIETGCSTSVPRNEQSILRRSAQDLRFGSRGVSLKIAGYAVPPEILRAPPQD
jgi:hypothetical protein